MPDPTVRERIEAVQRHIRRRSYVDAHHADMLEVLGILIDLAAREQAGSGEAEPTRLVSSPKSTGDNSPGATVPPSPAPEPGTDAGRVERWAVVGKVFLMMLPTFQTRSEAWDARSQYDEKYSGLDPHRIVRLVELREGEVITSEGELAALRETAVEGVVVQGATQWRPNAFSPEMTVSEHVVKVDYEIGTRVRVSVIPKQEGT